MEALIQQWLNPINLGIFLLCAATSVWILSRCGVGYAGK